jgi:hypothetical protein
VEGEGDGYYDFSDVGVQFALPCRVGRRNWGAVVVAEAGGGNAGMRNGCYRGAGLRAVADTRRL